MFCITWHRPAGTLIHDEFIDTSGLEVEPVNEVNTGERNNMKVRIKVVTSKLHC